MDILEMVTKKFIIIFILFPIYNFILAVKEGDNGDNQYGSDPKAE
jgi:hypothetical protein